MTHLILQNLPHTTAIGAAAGAPVTQASRTPMRARSFRKGRACGGSPPCGGYGTLGRPVSRIPGRLLARTPPTRDIRGRTPRPFLRAVGQATGTERVTVRRRTQESSARRVNAIAMHETAPGGPPPRRTNV
jgi:hypothetical protein